MPTRHVTKRDGRLEGEPDVDHLNEAERLAKEAERDLTSLSAPPPRAKEPRSR
ncbi:MAG TPA: hypothetical protein VM889_03590 [Candidatus Thermoplasmatota archaeon]|nr:hypothetical protein [Candidatus Thermoplasmatota archaeon]